MPYPVWSVGRAAYAALNLILGGQCYPAGVDEQGVETAGDEDPAMYAANACAISDSNLPGDWLNNPDNALPLDFHAENTLGFWEWWLATAVPGAWAR